MASSPRKFAVHEAVIATRLDDEAVLLNTRTGQYFGLDEVAARIWELLGEGADEDALVRQVAAEYDAPLDAIQQDVAAFLTLLHSRSLIVATPDAQQALPASGAMSGADLPGTVDLRA